MGVFRITSWVPAALLLFWIASPAIAEVSQITIGAPHVPQGPAASAIADVPNDSAGIRGLRDHARALLARHIAAKHGCAQVDIGGIEVRRKVRESLSERWTVRQCGRTAEYFLIFVPMDWSRGAPDWGGQIMVSFGERKDGARQVR